MILLKLVSITKVVHPSNLVAVLENPVCKQCIRWKRKPIHLPTAKSKIFKVSERQRYRPGEDLEMNRLLTNFNTSMKTVRKYLEDEVKASQSSEDSSEPAPALVMEKAQDFERCQGLNEEWNARIKLIRESRLQEEREERNESIKMKLEEHAIKEQNKIAAIEEMVKLEKAQEKSYITPDNIDEAIENLLQNEVDYNFAIDTEGNIYYGLNMEPGVKEEQLKTHQETRI